MKVVKCEHCGKEKQITNGKYNESIKLNRGHFCNNKCVCQWRNDKLYGKLTTYTVRCAKCGNELNIDEREKHYPKKERYFCNTHCARSYSTSDDDNSATKIVNCTKCGKTINVNKRSSKFLCEFCKVKGSPKISHKNTLIGQCDYCGLVTNSKDGKFCNNTCRGNYKYLIKLNK